MNRNHDNVGMVFATNLTIPQYLAITGSQDVRDLVLLIKKRNGLLICLSDSVFYKSVQSERVPRGMMMVRDEWMGVNSVDLTLVDTLYIGRYGQYYSVCLYSCTFLK